MRSPAEWQAVTRGGLAKGVDELLEISVVGSFSRAGYSNSSLPRKLE